MSKIKNLSWLKSLNSEKLQYSLSSKAVPNNSITRTKTFQIRVELEDMDQENRRLIQALNYVKTCNKELAGIFGEERDNFDKIVSKYEELTGVNSSLKIGEDEVLPSAFHRKGKTPKNFKKQIILNQKTREENKRANPGFALSTKRRSQSLVHNVVLQSEQDIHNNSRAKIKGSFEKIRKSLKVNEVSSEVNAFELFKIDRKGFELFIRQILSEEPHFFPEPKVLHRNISILKMHIQELEKRIYNKRKSQAFSTYRQALAFNAEMTTEIARLKALQNQITQNAFARFSTEQEALDRFNQEIELEMKELEQLLELTSQNKLELQEEIHDRNNYLAEKESQYLEMFEQNEAIIGELVRHQNEIDELKVKIQELNKS